jgi:hypothetical protein
MTARDPFKGLPSFSRARCAFWDNVTYLHPRAHTRGKMALKRRVQRAYAEVHLVGRRNVDRPAPSAARDDPDPALKMSHSYRNAFTGSATAAR